MVWAALVQSSFVPCVCSGQRLVDDWVRVTASSSPCNCSLAPSSFAHTPRHAPWPQTCNIVGKPVLITRVVDTMAVSPRPTRAEATGEAGGGGRGAGVGKSREKGVGEGGRGGKGGG